MAVLAQGPWVVSQGCPRGDPELLGPGGWVLPPPRDPSSFSWHCPELSSPLLPTWEGFPSCLDSTQVFLHLPSLSIRTLLSSPRSIPTHQCQETSSRVLSLPPHFSMSPGSLGHPQRVRARGLCGHWAAQSLLSPSPCPGASRGAGDAQEPPNPKITLDFEPPTCLPSRNSPSTGSQAGRDVWGGTLELGFDPCRGRGHLG